MTVNPHKPVMLVAGLLTFAVAGWLIAAGKGYSAFALTLTVVTGMINGLWLERLLELTLQPGKPRYSRRVVFIIIARLAVWGGLFALLFVLRKRIDLWVVAAGIVIVLAALAVSVGVGEENPGSED